MTTLFVSDIHIGAEHPEISQRFVAFLEQQATKAEVIYILGDLFEVWIGDDAAQAEHQAALDALRQLTASGVTVYVMHGNRDFLLDQAFEKLTGCQLISDPLVIDLYGIKTLLMHGDTLCVDDVEYQSFRRQVRGLDWQQNFLAMPAEQRIALATEYRAESRNQTRQKPAEIMDVNQDEVEKVMREHEVSRLIHGHTHRPGAHSFSDREERELTRIVLGDWYSQNSMLICNNEDCSLETSTES